MLQLLKIRNLALMDATELEFALGFTAVTGETGAGKSVLLGALSLLSGARAEKTLIRQGAEACEVEASLYFQNPAAIDTRLAELGLPPCEEGMLLLQRTLNRAKAPRFEVNGRMTTLANLQALGDCWIDFHGPGEPQKLFHEKWQLELLDLYAKAARERAAYGELYYAWKNILAQAESLRTQDRLSPEEAEFLQMQIDKIDRADLSTESVERLERDYARLSGAEEMIELAGNIEAGLGSDAGAARGLPPLMQAAQKLALLDPEAAALADRMESLSIELDDLEGEYATLAAKCDFDAGQADGIRERMELWMDLMRKYGPQVDAVLARRKELAAKLAAQGDIEGTLEQLAAEAEKTHAQALEAAEKLRAKRVKAAADLGKKAEKLINALGFKKAKLAIDVHRETELKEHGNSACRFQFAPNAGQEPLPLNKIASSGEIARVMLAIKAVLARVDATPVLVFDEVDANVGGEIAKAVAEELASLGGNHQVFVVTHLPQVAARAKNHLVVTKSQSGKSTQVEIEPLDGNRDARLAELARMLGDRDSATALNHAEELLEAVR